MFLALKQFKKVYKVLLDIQNYRYEKQYSKYAQRPAVHIQKKKQKYKQYQLMLRIIFCFLSIICAYTSLIQVQNYDYKAQYHTDYKNTKQENIKSVALSELYTRLASLEDIDYILQDGDPVFLVQLLKSIKNRKNSLDCKQLKKYIIEINNKITQKIVQKLNQISPHQVQSKKYEYEMSYLTKIRDTLQQTKQQMKQQISKNQQQIILGITNLSEIIKQTNYYKQKQQLLHISENAHIKSIQLLTKQIKSDKDQILQSKLDLSSSEMQIKNIEQKLAQAKQRKYLKQQKYKSTSNKLKNNENKKIQYEKKLSDIQTDIKQIQKSIDQLKLQSFQKQINLEKKRSKSNQLKIQISIKFQQLSAINAEISNTQQQFISNYDIQGAYSQIDLLKLINQQLRQQFSEVSQTCNATMLHTQPSQQIYLQNKQQFTNYLTTKYRYKILSQQVQSVIQTNMKHSNLIKFYKLGQDIQQLNKCWQGQFTQEGRLIQKYDNILKVFSKGQILSVIIDQCTNIQSFFEEITLDRNIMLKLRFQDQNLGTLKASDIFIL